MSKTQDPELLIREAGGCQIRIKRREEHQEFLNKSKRDHKKATGGGDFGGNQGEDLGEFWGRQKKKPRTESENFEEGGQSNI